MRPGTVIANRFVVAAFAGAGGMGTVYRAFDREQQQHVALKLVAKDDPSFSARFTEESRILAGLAHPAIVRWIAHGEADGQRWLALEWLEGEDLAARLERGPLTVEETLAVGLAAAEALAAAHAHGVVHRDIKPSNLFLVGGDPRRVKLLDFGVARRNSATRAITRSGVLLGTAGYIAPEQISGDPTDARADVFCLGVVLYECLTGQPAFAGGQVQNVLAKLLLEEPTPLRRLRGDIPPEVDALITRMLAKDPGARPASGAAVEGAIRGLCQANLRPSSDEPEDRAPFGVDEQHAVSLVVAMMEGTTRVEAAFAELGMRADALSGGLLLVQSKVAGIPADEALRAARGALRLHALLEHEVADKPKIAVVTGLSQISDRLPAGELLDRATSLLATPALAGEAILIDAVTAALLGTRFDVQRAPSGWELRGESEPDASRFVLDGPGPFVGRERELGTLTALFEECTGERLARAVLVTGPAGIGKSRLGREAMLRIGAMRSELEIWTARGDLLGDATPHGVLRSLVRKAGGTTLGDVAQAFPRLVGAVVESRPLLVVLEDLQWADAPSVQTIEQTLRSLHDRPLFVLALARPEVHDRFPRIWAECDAQEINLGGLAPRVATRLLHHALGPDAEPAKVAAIVERAGGNPFYLEELGRAAAEGRADTLPEAVLAMLEARLAVLAPEERRFLRAASVFGDVFWVRGALRVLGSAFPAVVSTLVERGLLERHPASRFPDEEELSFRDPLLREAAYATLTVADRSQGQALAAAWLESGGRADTRVSK